MTEQYQLVSAIERRIFRAYDIRGIVDRDLNVDVIYSLGRAIGSQALSSDIKQIAVAFDGRHTGPAYAEALSAGIADSGCDVLSVGMVPSPVLYYAAITHCQGSGVMITGSHNPAEYNGLKIMLAGDTLTEQQLANFRQQVLDGELATGQGTITAIDIVDDYIHTLSAKVSFSRPLKVVIDCGNGVTGMMAEKCFRALGCETIMLFDEVDGGFPNHHPDPTAIENCQDMIKAVQQHQADIGIGFDGDGDRIGMITNGGEFIQADRLLMLFAESICQRQPGATIVYDVKCTKHLETHINQFGGHGIMTKTGHALIKAKMRETGALLAGEMSGHLFFSDNWFGFDDALYAGARLLEIIANQPATSDDLFAAIPNSINTPELSIEIDDERKFAFIDAFIQQAKFDAERLITIDGLRVEFADGWGLLRASNTTPKLVLRFEADTEEALARIRQQFDAQLSAVSANF